MKACILQVSCIPHRLKLPLIFQEPKKSNGWCPSHHGTLHISKLASRSGAAVVRAGKALAEYDPVPANPFERVYPTYQSVPMDFDA